MDVKLVVVGGKQAGAEIPVAVPEFLIGRGTECRLQPRSSLVSRKHCSIVVEAETVSIKDFGSTNGTLVNGERVQGRRELSSGDNIRVGLLELEIRFTAGAVVKTAKTAAIHETAGRATTADDDLDISDWLEDGQQTAQAAAPDEKTTVHDTAVGKPVDETVTSMPTAVEQKKEPKKEAKPTKVAGQFQRKKAPIADSSKTAAEDVLRKFFNRRP